jgi:hypothetical protein
VCWEGGHGLKIVCVFGGCYGAIKMVFAASFMVLATGRQYATCIGVRN